MVWVQTLLLFKPYYHDLNQKIRNTLYFIDSRGYTIYIVIYQIYTDTKWQKQQSNYTVSYCKYYKYCIKSAVNCGIITLHHPNNVLLVC